MAELEEGSEAFRKWTSKKWVRFLTWVFFGMMQFHMGIRIGLLAKGATGHFNPELMLKAMARGAAMNIDLTDTWDPWTVMDRDIDELRAEYNIAPKE